MKKTYQTSRSKIYVPEPLRKGRQCVIITDYDTPETIRKKLTPDVGYFIDLRNNSFEKIEELLSRNTAENKEPEKKYEFY